MSKLNEETITLTSPSSLGSEFPKLVKQLESSLKKIEREKQIKIEDYEKDIKKLKTIVEELENRKNHLQKDIESEVKEKWKKYEIELDLLNKKYVEDDEIIYLNIGGVIYQCLSSTLKGEVPKSLEDEDIFVPHFLSAMSLTNCPVIKDKNGNMFIDRDPKHFRYILNYLRVRGNLKSFVCPTESQVIQELAAETEYYCLNHFHEFLVEGGYYKSKILDRNQFKKLIIDCFGEKESSKTTIDLLFKTEKDGYSSTSFHAKVYGKGPCIVIAKLSNGYVCGGYNHKDTGSNKYIQDANCFLFSCVNAEGKKFYKFTQKTPNGLTHALYDNQQYIGWGGGKKHFMYLLIKLSGHDLCLYLNQANQASNYTNLNYSYTDLGKGKHFLSGGTRTFNLAGIEVYSIKQNRL